MRPCFVVEHIPQVLAIEVMRVCLSPFQPNLDPDATESFCIYCLRELPTSDFFWSRRKARWTMTCRDCEQTGYNKSKKDDGKDFYRPVPVLQQALDHNRLKRRQIRAAIDTSIQLSSEQLRHLCERFILLDERCRLISEKIDEVEFMQAAVEAQEAENTNGIHI